MKIYLPPGRSPFAQKSGHSSKQPPKWVQHYGFMHNVEVSAKWVRGDGLKKRGVRVEVK